MAFGVKAVRSNSLSVSEQRSVNPLHREVTEIFKQFRDPIFRYLLGLLHDPGEAEDATQDAFLRLYLEMRKGRQIEPRPWLFRVAHNLAIDRLRQQSPARVLDEQAWVYLSDTRPDSKQDTQHKLLRREQQQRLEMASRRLSPHERRCIDLRMEGLRYREIAEAMGVRISSVESHISRAVRKIVRELDA